jgi:hypothetical protein
MLERFLSGKPEEKECLEDTDIDGEISMFLLKK